MDVAFQLFSVEKPVHSIMFFCLTFCLFLEQIANNLIDVKLINVI